MVHLGLKRVWIATTKLLKQQIDKNRCVELPYLGKFCKLESTVSFMPSLNFLGACKVRLIESETLVLPLSKASQRFLTAKPLSLTYISAVCQLDRESTAANLRSIVSEFISLVRAGKASELDLKVGILVGLENKSLAFEQLQSVNETSDENCSSDPYHQQLTFKQFSLRGRNS